jgi:hypothetical protein
LYFEFGSLIAPELSGLWLAELALYAQMSLESTSLNAALAEQSMT